MCLTPSRVKACRQAIKDEVGVRQFIAPGLLEEGDLALDCVENSCLYEQEITSHHAREKELLLANQLGSEERLRFVLAHFEESGVRRVRQIKHL